MKFKRKYTYTLVTEDGKYSIRKDHFNDTYYITSNGKKLIHGTYRKTFGKQKDAKAFVEKIYEEGLNDTYRWL